MLEVGDHFPVEKLAVEPKGPAVVYFYPADLTPGCTMEAKAFNDNYDRFRGAGYEVIGVSTDSDERHEEFRQECGLRFPLVSDEGAELTGSLGHTLEEACRTLRTLPPGPAGATGQEAEELVELIYGIRQQLPALEGKIERLFDEAGDPAPPVPVPSR